MPKIKYEDLTFKPDSRKRIEQANEIIAEYAAAGYELTLRQLYYQFVARGLIPNNDREYKKLGDVIANARLAGLIDWDAIVDRTRFLRALAHWESPTDIVDACSRQFRYDKWARQPYYVECAVEKDALIGVLERVCNEHDVPYLACRGYASASEIWRAGHERFRPRLRKGKQCLLLYLGDHDPSGIDMTRDLRERLDQFTRTPGGVEVRRLALNMPQVEEYEPPPNPAKLTDSRAQGYIDEFGDESWELDALDPVVISDLIRNAIESVRDDTLWEEDVAREEEARRHLAGVAKNWEDVISNLHDDEGGA